MAKKADGSFREIMTAIRAGKFSPIYILMGEEAYYIDAIVKALEQSVVSEDEKDFNCNIFYGNDADLDMVMTAAKQFPMMAQRRLVVLKEAQSVPGNKTSLDRLEPYMSRPNPSCVFVLAFKGGVLNVTSKLLKAAKASNAVVFSSPKLRDYEVPNHIRDYCTSLRINIDEKAIGMLTETVGTSVSKIVGEIDKLVLASGNAANLRITPEMVERNIGVSKDFNSFELVNALATRNYAKAMRIVDSFAKNPRQNPTEKVCPAIFSFYQNMVLATFQKDKSDASLMKALGLKNTFALRDIKSGMQHIDAHKAVMCVDAIRRFDAMTKGIGSMQNSHQLLKELIFKLFTLR